MIIKDGENPFDNSKILRGFNNTKSNIVDQMEISRKNLERFKKLQEANEVRSVDNTGSNEKKFDPSKQRERNIQMERISKDL